jgi:hypothetical protein
VEGSFESKLGQLGGHQVQVYRAGNMVRTGYVEGVTHTRDGLGQQAKALTGERYTPWADGYSVKALRAHAQKNG